jgi:hypothetical protein
MENLDDDRGLHFKWLAADRTIFGGLVISEDATTAHHRALSGYPIVAIGSCAVAKGLVIDIAKSSNEFFVVDNAFFHSGGHPTMIYLGCFLLSVVITLGALFVSSLI